MPNVFAHTSLRVPIKTKALTYTIPSYLLNGHSIYFQGGFAKCYEMKNMATGEIMACKVVPKSLLVKQNQREKMAQEIRFAWHS